MIGTLVYLILVLAIFAVLFWAVSKILGVLPIEEPFRTIILVVFVLVVLLIAVDMFFPYLGGRRLLW